MAVINQQPDINRLLKVLKREPVDSPVLFEFIIDDKFLRKFSTSCSDAPERSPEYFRMLISAFKNLGYDYVHFPSWQSNFLEFPKNDFETKESRSLNCGNLITDENTMEAYPWPDPQDGDYSILQNMVPYLPDGMKILVSGPGGILENAIDIGGFENLCMKYMMDPAFTCEFFNRIGSRLLEYYRIISSFESVAVVIYNDDWGFKTQTMFPPDMMQEYVFPWVRKIVDVIHSNNKPAILHSCGNLKNVMDEIITELKFDGKHSFEDNITPVEEAYDLWGEKIAIMGGIDLDFLARKSPEEIRKRTTAMISKTAEKGGFALGSGNSIPAYIPEENFLALIGSIYNY